MVGGGGLREVAGLPAEPQGSRFGGRGGYRWGWGWSGISALRAPGSGRHGKFMRVISRLISHVFIAYTCAHNPQFDAAASPPLKG